MRVRHDSLTGVSFGAFDITSVECCLRGSGYSALQIAEEQWCLLRECTTELLIVLQRPVRQIKPGVQ